VMAGAGLWEQEGLDVRDVTFSDDPLGTEEQLVSGAIDFVFGNHVSPYMRLAQGYPLVCLAQTENWEDIWVATAPGVRALPGLRRKRVVALPLMQGDEFAGHANGSRLLMLELQGVDTRELDYVDPESVAGGIEAVQGGEADACFIGPERAARATAAGLRVHELPRLPMVHSITFTTTLPTITRQPELAERVIRVLASAIHYFKTRRAETLALLQQPVQPIPARRLERIEQRYDEYAADYEGRLYPHPQAIVNVHRLACMAYPGSDTVNPMELWDMHPLRLVHASGFIDKLYAGGAAVGSAARAGA
jgi:ABC-type nitrate/sulfonate/bicarbonate transport system substrate-binding protein